MTPHEQIIFAAFTQSLVRFPDNKLPDDLQSKLNQLPNVRENALKLEKLIKTNADLAKLYQEECDRLMAEASDRQKGFLPIVTEDPYNTERGNLVEQLEQICHASNSAGEAKNLLKSQGTGGIFGFFKRIFSD